MIEKDQSGKPSKFCLPEDSHFVCTLASSVMQTFFENCFSGDIIFEEINMIDKKKHQVIQLFTAGYNGSPDDKKLETKKFIDLIDCRIQQAKRFGTQKNVLVSLCRQLSTKQPAIVNGKCALLLLVKYFIVHRKCCYIYGAIYYLFLPVAHRSRNTLNGKGREGYIHMFGSKIDFLTNSLLFGNTEVCCYK